ncbi:MAG: helix-hairpin-helix domain-containing protein [Prevotella sp.]|nr:helix-hairpin-helix domain-containing protein [Prevotella sp.]
MKFFYLQKSDRHVITLLLCVIVAALAVIYFTDSREDETPAMEEVKAPKGSKNKYPKKSYTYNQGQPRQPELFPFDPNTADSTELLRLGLQPWQVVNIYKYRAAGGVYRKPRDFARLYGLTLKEYRRLEPYIRISEENLPAENYFYKYEPIEERDTVKYPVKLQPEERVVLNRADTAQLRKVPGIGSFFARKIVEYRERLGGYYRVQQLLEIEDFPETAVSFFIIPDGTEFRKMNLNRLSLNELKRHPYIGFYRARAIVDYRRLHGHIESLQQLKLLPDFTPEAIERLEPYVEY